MLLNYIKNFPKLVQVFGATRKDVEDWEGAIYKQMERNRRNYREVERFINQFSKEKKS